MNAKVTRALNERKLTSTRSMRERRQQPARRRHRRTALTNGFRAVDALRLKLKLAGDATACLVGAQNVEDYGLAIMNKSFVNCPGYFQGICLQLPMVLY
ncbi:unnamed protein product [Cylicocyclus nassatus]|uniref:Uncharacterized protein n=1 Tax=Cylicocyclus nassatus TaxID=53992 RepID=A0AA36HA28_CYLNA|nr:unnamed protein product [Cylicocyclus nassatus]